MDSLTIVLIAAAIVVALIIVQAPVFTSLLVGGTVGLVLLKGWGVAGATLSQQPFSYVASFALLAVPLFVAMGVIAKNSNMPDAAFNVANRLTAGIPGGLAVASIFACAGFAAITGSSVATATAIGPIAIQKMTERGYNLNVAAGVIAAAGTMGVLIPPSIVLVIYGIITGESIGALLLAGFIPGVVSAILYSVALVWRAKRRPDLFGQGLPADSNRGALASGEQENGTRRASRVHLGRDDVLGVLKVVTVFTVVVGGIYSGLFTAVEAGAVGAFVVLIFVAVEQFRSGRLGFRVMARAIADSMVLNAMVFGLMVGASVFTVFIVSARVPQDFTAWATSLRLPGWAIVALLLLILIPMGMFLDGVSMMLITVPIAYPVVVALGFNGIWYGILVVKMIEISLITPPVGVSVFVVSGLHPKLTPEGTFRGVAPFFFVDLVTIAVLFMVPSIVLWLPGQA